MKTDNIISFLGGVISTSSLYLAILTAGHQGINKTNPNTHGIIKPAPLQVSSQSETPAQKEAREVKELEAKFQLISDRLADANDQTDRQLKLSLARISRSEAERLNREIKEQKALIEAYKRSLQAK